MTRLVFMDTETGGLAPDAEVWDFAAIVRDPDTADVEVQFFIEHDRARIEADLPEPFYSDYRARYNPRTALAPDEAAQSVWNITRGAHIVGAVPNFDTERLALLLRAYGREPEWHYHLIDCETLAVGWLHGASGLLERHDTVPLALPWDSDELSTLLGVEPPKQGEGRHTALGDARWCLDLYDAATSPG